MKKHGDERDINRRRDHVSNIQDGVEWRQRRTLPPANKTWPTCLIIAPTSVVPNWEREFQTVSAYKQQVSPMSHHFLSGGILKSDHIQVRRKSGMMSSPTSKWAGSMSVCL
jgi:hypothetical protein